MTAPPAARPAVSTEIGCIAIEMPPAVFVPDLWQLALFAALACGIIGALICNAVRLRRLEDLAQAAIELLPDGDDPEREAAPGAAAGLTIVGGRET